MTKRIKFDTLRKALLYVVWHPKARTEISTFPEEMKSKLGYLIYRLQLKEKLKMPHSKTISTISKGARELRVRGRDGSYRCFYFILKDEFIIVFHAFNKKTQKTPLKEIDQGRRNLEEVKLWLKEK